MARLRVLQRVASEGRELCVVSQFQSFVLLGGPKAGVHEVEVHAEVKKHARPWIMMMMTFQLICRCYLWIVLALLRSRQSTLAVLISKQCMGSAGGFGAHLSAHLATELLPSLFARPPLASRASSARRRERRIAKAHTHTQPRGQVAEPDTESDLE